MSKEILARRPAPNPDELVKGFEECRDGHVSGEALVLSNLGELTAGGMVV